MSPTPVRQPAAVDFNGGTGYEGGRVASPARAGLIGYALNARLTHKEFWTVSVWESRDELERFAGADPHATIIRTKPERMAESKFVFWSCRGRDLPVRWGVVAEHLDAPVS